MGRFETVTPALAENRVALADLGGQWIDRFQLAEVAVTGQLVRAILTAICRLRTPPSCA